MGHVHLFSSPYDAQYAIQIEWRASPAKTIQGKRKVCASQSAGAAVFLLRLGVNGDYKVAAVEDFLECGSR